MVHTKSTVLFHPQTTFSKKEWTVVTQRWMMRKTAHSVPDLINGPLMCIMKTAYKEHGI